MKKLIVRLLLLAIMALGSGHLDAAPQFMHKAGDFAVAGKDWALKKWRCATNAKLYGCTLKEKKEAIAWLAGGTVTALALVLAPFGVKRVAIQRAKNNVESEQSVNDFINTANSFFGGAKVDPLLKQQFEAVVQQVGDRSVAADKIILAVRDSSYPEERKRNIAVLAKTYIAPTTKAFSNGEKPIGFKAQEAVNDTDAQRAYQEYMLYQTNKNEAAKVRFQFNAKRYKQKNPKLQEWQIAADLGLFPDEYRKMMSKTGDM